MSIVSPLPFTIASGQVISANPLQSNFNSLVNDVNANAAPSSNPTLSNPKFTGILTNPSHSQPAFDYSLSASLVHPANGTVVVFGTPTFTQQGGLYNPATGILTCSAGAAGLWMISAQLSITVATTNASFNLLKNGVILKAAGAWIQSVSTINIVALVQLASTDTLTIATNASTTSATINADASASFFSGYFLG